MGCNCNEKKYNISMGCCVPVLAPIENYYTKTEVDELIESAITSGSCCITPEEVDEKIASAKTEIEGEIPTVPTSNTAFTNDARYITGVDLSNYSTTDEVTTLINQSVSGKQDTLSAGTNITIVDNVISAVNTTYTSGRGINITNNTVSLNLPISAGTGSNSIKECDYNNVASGQRSHAEGTSTRASGTSSHAEGDRTIASGSTSHAEGYKTNANGSTSHAEGWITNANGSSSHAEGLNANANGDYSHAEGHDTVAKGSTSHAEGEATYASGNYSHTEGKSTSTYNDSEHASGQYNVSSSASTTFGDSGNTLFSVGNGTSANDKHNAFEIRQNGDIYITSGGTDIKLQDALNQGGGSGITSGEVQTMIDNSISGKQDTMSAGTNVQINNNVISATDTTYTAGDNITISNQNVISTVTKFWCGTQLEYDAILVKDPNTVYMIHS